MRSWHRELLAACTVVLGVGFPLYAQAQSGPATLENLVNSPEAQGTPAVPEVAPKRPAGTVVRPKDGVQHPDLDKAWAEYDAVVTTAAEGIKAAISKQFDAATAKGDLDAAEKWQTALEKFEKAGEVPIETETKATVNAALGDYKKAREELGKAYESVVKALTMEKKIAEAKAVRGELAGFTSPKPSTATHEEKPGKQTSGTLFVSCDDKVTIWFRDKIVGKSSQWGQLVGIPLKLGQGAEVLFVAESSGNNPAGVSWLFVSDDLKHWIASDTTNTSGMPGLVGKGAKFGECVEGRHWVSDSLVNRLDLEIKAKAFTVMPVEPRIVDTVERKMPVASYRWKFDPADLQPVK
jgi:hypothetical protein